MLRALILNDKLKTTIDDKPSILEHALPMPQFVFLSNSAALHVA